MNSRCICTRCVYVSGRTISTCDPVKQQWAQHHFSQCVVDDCYPRVACVNTILCELFNAFRLALKTEPEKIWNFVVRLSIRSLCSTKGKLSSTREQTFILRIVSFCLKTKNIHKKTGENQLYHSLAIHEFNQQKKNLSKYQTLSFVSHLELYLPFVTVLIKFHFFESILLNWIFSMLRKFMIWFSKIFYSDNNCVVFNNLKIFMLKLAGISGGDILSRYHDHQFKVRYGWRSITRVSTRDERKRRLAK